MPSGVAVVGAVALVLAIIVSASASLLSSSGARNQHQDIDAACVSPDCLTRAEVAELVGFRPLEPTTLPDGYVLYDRSVPKAPLPDEVRRMIAEQRGVPIDEVEEFDEPTAVHLQYRFNDRTSLPALQIIETIDPRAEVQLELTRPDCGDVLSILGRTAFYGEGLGSLQPVGNAGSWEACPAEGPRQVVNLIFSVDDVIVEVKAFPESGLNRGDLIAIAESMLKAESR